MPTPAEGGNPAAAPARRMVPLYPGATITVTRPPLPVDSREQLVYLLTQAAELEQGILCEYLFALYSLKRDPGEGLGPEQLALVTRWGDTLAEIAVQEMLHLTLATNLLTAVGATPHFHRPNFPIRCQWYPPDVQVALVPFGEEALRHFLYLERPDHVDVADAELFSRVCECRPLTATPATLMAEPQDYTTVGHLYRSIGHGFARLVERYGEAEVFIGPPEAQATRELLGWSELVAVTDLASAEAAIATIVEQGEGADGDWREAHFGRLSTILEEYLAATEADPSFQPARPAQPAYVRRPPDQPLAVVISDPLTAQVADVFDAAHQTLLQLLCSDWVSLPISRWLTMDFLFLNWYSTGSSMVRMWPVSCSLRLSMMEASVVLLPEPVAPTTRMRPRFSMIRSRSTGGRPSESNSGMCCEMKRITTA